MKDFTGKIAVITGGGTGMGRELARQLVAEGCHVAMCDVSMKNMDETKRLCEAEAAQGTRVAAIRADVSLEAEMKAFAAEAAKALDTDHIHLLFNNAGIGGGGSIVAGSRAEWDKTFNVCWGGVYYGVRAFLPLLMKAREGHIINTSSVNGFWASIGPGRPHTAYAAAKFAVKGFTEALQADLAINAPHIQCSVVMPGHIGTSIVMNSREVLGEVSKRSPAEEAQGVRGMLKTLGVDGAQFTDEQLLIMMDERAKAFRDNAPMSAAEAAKIILDAVKAGKWRILVGKDAEVLDKMVRAEPEAAYTQDFYERMAKAANWSI